MTEPEVKQALATLVLVAEAEHAVGRFYEACAEKDAEHAGVWNSIAAAEQRHVEAVRVMAKMLVDAKGAGYRIGHRFQPEAVQMFIDRVRKNEVDARTATISGRVLFLVARGLEDALLEVRFYEHVVSDDKGYRALVDGIAADTRAHQALMNAWAKAADV